VIPTELPALSRKERLAWEYQLLGLAPGDHVMRLYREQLRTQGILSSEELEEHQNGDMVRVAGLVVVRQRPATAKGHVFITLEDEAGLVNLIVRPHVYERYKEALRNARLLWAKGKLQREGLTISVLVHTAEAIC
jgi:error-prone DNA polymerase